ncbi:hypothetical protein SAMD00019534_006990 [Acytostelium subglobosum LB1]|uniref:hypothetical protein n=1 Tax=Acytostelium subglobosum LB1 TaxID=1410327 RepID=UPI000644F353|nr:hypothetical protein SAMD00019534_006990 [Acytostelium subglobosum LB1]GAM17524.1 hypothetical protein SAMD00019534_006990 [Acytostelium subglobosum LB1]|eukprot:XP_012759586.1 hypothetical protein SAMD00019534_006990 [Acytostelium subglobosum LB1]
MSAFPEIQRFIETKDFAHIIAFCQDIELKSEEQTRKYYPVYILSLLIQNDIKNARLLWNRIPSELKAADAHLKPIWSLTKHIAQLNYPMIYKSLTGNYGTDLAPFIIHLKETFQYRTFELISNSYSNISVNDCSVYLGIPTDHVLKYTESQGWTRDGNSLQPVPIKAKDSHVKSGNNLIHSLADFVLSLEK